MSESPFSSSDFKEPWRLQGESYDFQPCYTGLGDSKSGRKSKLHHWLKSYSNFAGGWFLPIGGVALGRVCACSRLVSVVTVAIGVHTKIQTINTMTPFSTAKLKRLNIFFF